LALGTGQAENSHQAATGQTQTACRRQAQIRMLNKRVRTLDYSITTWMPRLNAKWGAGVFLVFYFPSTTLIYANASKSCFVVLPQVFFYSLKHYTILRIFYSATPRILKIIKPEIKPLK